MGLEPFRQTDIRSAVMGIPITITEEVIAKACKVAPTGRFLWNISRKHPLLESFTSVVLKGNPETKLVDIEGHHRMLLKFMTECFFQKGGGSNQPSVDHKLVLSLLHSTRSIFQDTSCTICAALSKKESEARESRYPVEDCFLKSSLKVNY